VRFAVEPVVISCGPELDGTLEQLPTGPAVFAIFASEGEPHIGRTSILSRRLRRLLRRREHTSRLLNLREVASRVEYWPTTSRLESSLVMYEVARKHMPDAYLDFLKLRMAPLVRLASDLRFPRTLVTTRIAGGGIHYGPFRTRAIAEGFEHDLLDLFQLRRCQEDLAPAPDHPGCIYGEMNMCLRPCQQIVGTEEYASESARVAEFLRTSGRSALHAAESARERLSTDMEFEAAAQQHKRIERIQDLLRLREELARDLDTLNGVAVLPAAAGAVLLQPMIAGAWQRPIVFGVAGPHSDSMDARLREALAAVQPEACSHRERQEHVAILSRWFYSTWRDGAWIGFDSLARLPYRRTTSAISRVVHQNLPAASHSPR
jgi:excinuclease UvrABC nuclease subunit